MNTFDSIWDEFKPDDRSPWNLSRVVHLHRRAGFAATWGEIQRDLKGGMRAAVERLLVGTASAHTPVEFVSIANLLAQTAVSANDLGRMKAWWVYRMLFGPDPLGEKLTLLWHNHFATSNVKVANVEFMWLQNETFRKHARGKFADLLEASVHEPALLLYLDAQTNRKGHANENLARELMELFTLGIGNYTEADVKEAARCLTGWTVVGQRFAENNQWHDAGVKTVLGKTGKWTGTDLVQMLINQPETAQRIIRRLCEAFFGEKAPPEEAVSLLTVEFRNHQLDLGWAVGVILRSRLFFSNANVRTRVLSPVEFVIGAARALELFDPAPSTVALADWLGRLGQDLFEPPNVGGWTGGRNWLNPRAMIGRANFITALLEGTKAGRPSPFDATLFAKTHSVKPIDNTLFFTQLLHGTDVTDSLKKRLIDVEGSKVMATLLTAPEGQLG